MHASPSLRGSVEEGSAERPVWRCGNGRRGTSGAHVAPGVQQSQGCDGGTKLSTGWCWTHLRPDRLGCFVSPSEPSGSAASGRLDRRSVLDRERFRFETSSGRALPRSSPGGSWRTPGSRPQPELSARSARPDLLRRSPPSATTTMWWSLPRRGASSEETDVSSGLALSGRHPQVRNNVRGRTSWKPKERRT